MMTKATFAAVATLGWAITALPSDVRADAGGVGLWLPGIFGSLAAAPGVPGWSYASIYLHLQANSASSQNFVTSNGARGTVVTGLNAHGDALALGITYVSPMPVLGGQAAFSIVTAPGNVGVGIDATLTGPRGNAVSGGVSDNRTTLSDVFYQGTLKWNQGVHNEMVYITGNIPSGTYDPNRLANLNLGFVGWDAGAGYTYFDPKAGHEFSVVGGFTYSLPNPYLQYQNGIDFHVDWAASQFLSKTFQVGLAGYFYQQITDDTGPGAKLGGFRGRAIGIGPQVGFIFPKLFEGYSGYLNIRGYKDLEVENRANTWSTWVTFAVSPAPPEPASKPARR
ncbi:transporter [Bradyrhizobium sp. NBAIM20]|uniref:SphA family protein n=1 Tax=unclassified Bradyrhizobium TaxID=2631580 RepID=UPI001CD52FC0|nr:MULTISPECIES: transporter [unclassified Bradyrhizobium]MCA1411762.1 transporter [Bradyrhizobium sp. NBAIM20]MCA1460903.1 transporter [Bradyrhizobium sp. NBAIM18]